MLELIGPNGTTSDILSRRNCLKIGALGWGGLSLADLPNLHSHAAAATPGGRNDRAVILFWMAGGPSHLDTFDPKPDAPAECRGPFSTIDTSVPGLRFTDQLPMLARRADRCSIVRSLHHTLSVHDDASHWVQTGMPLPLARQQGQKHPAQSSIVAYARGANVAGVPANVCIPEAYDSNKGFYQRAAQLGAAYDPVAGGGDPTLGNYKLPEFSLPAELTFDRIDDRRSLRDLLDGLARRVDASPQVAALSESQRLAYDLVTGPRAREAFDLGQESATLRDRYGRHFWGQSALLARRLVEAGVTFVTINLYEANVDWWDDHDSIEKNLRKRLPKFDQSLATLIDDLHDRGLSDRVLVAAFGEFGRTPRIDAKAGRGHWPDAMSALLSGGGLHMGQVVGSTTADGGRPNDRPLAPNDLLATTYHALGIDPERTFVDAQNRPVRFLDSGAPIRELID